MALTRADIEAVSDLPVETISIPEWGGDVLVRALSIEQREEIEVRAHKAKTTGDALGWKGLKALVACYVLVDDEGKALFAAKDVGLLSKKSAAALERIFEFVMRTNGLSKQDAEDLAGN